MQGSSICRAVHRHPCQEHPLDYVRDHAVPGQHAVVDQRQGDISQDLHLQRIDARPVHAPAAADVLDQFIIADSGAQQLRLRIGMRGGPDHGLCSVAEVHGPKLRQVVPLRQMPEQAGAQGSEVRRMTAVVGR